MENWQREIITKNLSRLIELTDCNTHVLTNLLQYEIITDEEIKVIENLDGHQKNQKLYQLLLTRENAYGIICNILVAGKQSGAARILLHQPGTSSAGVENSIQVFERMPEVEAFLSNSLVISTTDYELTKGKIENIFKSGGVSLSSSTEQELANTENKTYTFKINPSASERKITVVRENDLNALKTQMEDSYRVIEDNFTWSNLTYLQKRNILEKPINFQGLKMSLRNLCERYENFSKKPQEELLKKLDGQLLVQLLNGSEIPIISNGNVPQVPHYYVPRTLRQRTHISRRIVGITKGTTGSKDILLFLGLELYELTTLVKKYGNGKWMRSSSVTDPGKLTCQAILLEKTEYADEFEKICKMTSHPVHILKCKKSDPDNKSEVKALEWIESRGSLKTIHEHIHTQQECFTEEKFLKENPNSMKSFCIAELPGNGKSTLMAKCAQLLIDQGRTDFYTQYVIIGEFIKELINVDDDGTFSYILEEPEETRPNKINSKQVPQINSNQEHKIPVSRIFKVLSENSCKSSFGRAFVKAFVKSPGVNCDYMFDGLEELPQNQLKLALSVIKYLRKYKQKYIRVWATTRKDLLEQLEESLGVLGHTICTFKDEDQVQMLTKYWHHDEVITSKLEQFAVHCLQELKAEISEGQKDIAGTPLLCLLLAEVYKDNALLFANCEETESFELTEFKINATKLYEEFIRKRFQTAKDDTERKQLEYAHMTLAIQLLLPNVFSKFSTSILLQDLTPLSNTELLRLGIIQIRFGRRKDTPRFIHKTIAEYFAAFSLLTIFKQIDQETDDERCNKWTELFTTVCRHILAVESSEIVLSEVSSQPCYRKSYKFQHTNICHFLNLILKQRLQQRTIKAILFYYEKNVHETDLKFKLWKCLHAAVVSNFTEIAIEIISSLNHLCPKEEQKGEFRQNVDGDKESSFKCLLFFAARYGCEKLMKNVREFFELWTKESVIAQEIERTNFPPVKGKYKTLFHVAVEAGNYLVANCLLDKHGYGSQLGDEKYENLLHFCLLKSNRNSASVIKGKIKIIDRLAKEHNTIFFQPDAVNYAVLNLLTKQVNLELLFRLLHHMQEKKLKIVSLKNQRRENILHLLPKSHYDEHMTPKKYHESLLEIKKYFDLNELFNAKDRRFGWTPVEMAVSALDLEDETIMLLQEHLNKTDTVFRAIAGQRSPEFLYKLIDHGANWQHTISGGKTVLHSAAEKYNYGAVQLFTQRFQTDINGKDHMGNTPLHICLQKRNEVNLDQSFDIESGIVSQRSVYNSGSSDEETPAESENTSTDKKQSFNYKMEGEVEPNNQHRIITHLMKNGARIDEKNKEGKTPLQVAIEICKGLNDEEFKNLNNVENFDASTYSTALRGIILNEKIGSVWHPDLITSFAERLRQEGATLDFRDVDGSTLLHLAAKNHSMGVEYLLQHGLTPKQKNYSGKTALESMECNEECQIYNCMKIRNLLKE